MYREISRSLSESALTKTEKYFDLKENYERK